jgi:hypothetical protein
MKQNGHCWLAAGFLQIDSENTMRYRHPVTPAEINPTLASLCEQLAPATTPFYVEVAPLQDAPANECFPLVDAHVGQHGGELLLGWSLWEMPGLFVEAEFHAIWRSPIGVYVDIAPKAQPTARILFLPSADAVYDNRQVNNVRKAVGNNPDVERYLRGFDEIFEFMNRGERANLHGEVHLEGAAAMEYEQIQRRTAVAHQTIAHLFPFYGAYLPCWCGSGKKTKWCHKSVTYE